MNAFSYSIGMHALAFLAKCIAPFNSKLKLGILGRKNTFSNLESWRQTVSHTEQIIWFHCASLGEFEQGRPVIEELKRSIPELKIALTFFSPSGYEIRKNYSQADWVGYLPFDTPRNAKKFVEILNPNAAAFVKYEFWANYFFELKSKQIPLVSFSCIFQPNQRFFKRKNGFWNEVLSCVKYFFVQNVESGKLLSSIELTNFEITGDTRFDRVVEIAQNHKQLPWLESFKSSHELLVIGSSYLEEEKWALTWLESDPNIRICIVPHDVDNARILATCTLFKNHSIERYSRLTHSVESRVIVVDEIGMLSSIYAYADFVIIGGGFHKGIHNTLEAAVYDVPLFFGPKYQKFQEAKDLIEIGAASAGNSFEEMRNFFSKFTSDKKSSGGKKFVKGNTGASKKISNYLLGLVQKK